MFLVICYSSNKKQKQLCFPEYALNLVSQRIHCLILTCFATWKGWKFPTAEGGCSPKFNNSFLNFYFFSHSLVFTIIIRRNLGGTCNTLLGNIPIWITQYVKYCLSFSNQNRHTFCYYTYLCVFFFLAFIMKKSLRFM